MSQAQSLRIDIEGLRWFGDGEGYDDEGNELCSACGLPVPDGEGAPLLFRERSPTDVGLARLHTECWNARAADGSKITCMLGPSEVWLDGDGAFAP